MTQPIWATFPIFYGICVEGHTCEAELPHINEKTTSYKRKCGNRIGNIGGQGCLQPATTRTCRPCPPPPSTCNHIAPHCNHIATTLQPHCNHIATTCTEVGVQQSNGVCANGHQWHLVHVHWDRRHGMAWHGMACGRVGVLACRYKPLAFQSTWLCRSTSQQHTTQPS